MLLFEDKCFKVISYRGGCVLIRKDYPYSHHSHFRDIQGAKTVIKLFHKKLIPYRKYFRSSIERVTTKEELEKFGQQKPKQKYKNRR